MRNETSSDEDIRELRKGWATGACAAAAARAAYQALLTGHFPDPVEIILPKGQRPSFALVETGQSKDVAMAAIEKDAGDDPDVTHGAIIRAEVRLRKEPGIGFHAGAGVGCVTKPGLPLKVGEPAINPGPRQIISENIQAVAESLGAPGHVAVTLSVDNGQELAKKTWNPRLGIVGGLSILGTTGIVVPYSCSAWIASIHQAIDVGRADGLDHMAGCTGSTSEQAVAARYRFGDGNIIDMGDFAGGLLKYVRDHPIPKLTIAGGFAKLSKLAEGHMDLHSKRSQVDVAALASLVAELTDEEPLLSRVRTAETAGQVLLAAEEAGLPLGNAVAAKAKAVCAGELRSAADVEVIVYNRQGQLVGEAPFESQ